MNWDAAESTILYALFWLIDLLLFIKIFSMIRMFSSASENTTPFDFAHATHCGPYGAIGPSSVWLVTWGRNEWTMSRSTCICLCFETSSLFLGFYLLLSFQLLGQHFLFAIEPVLQDHWTPEVEQAWADLFRLISHVMKEAMVLWTFFHQMTWVDLKSICWISPSYKHDFWDAAIIFEDMRKCLFVDGQLDLKCNSLSEYNYWRWVEMKWIGTAARNEHPKDIYLHFPTYETRNRNSSMVISENFTGWTVWQIPMCTTEELTIKISKDQHQH